jgi:hypothetical protein
MKNCLEELLIEICLRMFGKDISFFGEMYCSCDDILGGNSMICDNSKKASVKTEQSLEYKSVRGLLCYKKTQLNMMPRPHVAWAHPVH